MDGDGSSGSELASQIAAAEDKRRAAEDALLASEQRFHHLVDAVTDYAIYLLDARGNVTTWNEGARRIKGYDEAEIIGRHFSVFYTPEDRAAGKPERVLESVRREGRFEEENWRVRKDGTRFWASVVLTALRGSSGEITGFAKVTRDLTARRRAEENERKLAAERLARATAEAERNRVLALFERVPAVVNFLRGPDLVFEIAHPKAVEALGGRELVGRPVAEAVPEYRQQPQVLERMRRVYETGEPSSFHELAVRSANGGVEATTYWDSVHLPVRDAAGRIDGVMTFEVDVTEAVIARRQIERANRSLRALADLASALAKAGSPEEVGLVIVQRGVQISRADTCVLYALDEAGTALELVIQRGFAPEAVERVRVLSEAEVPEAFAALRTGETCWAETPGDHDRLYAPIARLSGEGTPARASWSIPLVIEGAAVGLLSMGFHDERSFPAEERELVEGVGKQCAQALSRAIRARREQRVRAWLDTTLRSIGDAVITTDTDGRVTMMNAVAERLTGWREGEARGRPLVEVFAIFSEETRAPCDNPVEKVLREGTIVGLANHTVLPARSGTYVPIDDSAAPIRDARGGLFGVVLVFRDVSAEKRDLMRRDFLARAGAALASSLDYRATLARAAQLAVPRLADWCTVHLLESGERSAQRIALAHVDPDKVKAVTELATRYPPDPEASSGPAEVIRTGRPELYPEVPPGLIERAARDADHLRLIRELQLRSAMIVPLRGRERVFGAISFVYAESARRYGEEDLAFAEEFARRAAMAIENGLAFRQAEAARAEERRLRQEADVANQAKDEFLATVSHELRTPLNAILGWTSSLRARNSSPELDRSLAVIERNARRQARLIDDVLDVSRIISGKLTLNLGPTSVAEAVERAIEAVTPAADAKQIRIRSELDASFVITADGDRLQQVVWNLLSNAIKFTPKGGEIDVRMYRDGSLVCMCISDNGEGIAPDALPVIFEPFRQADASTTRKHGGLGLGLAIVRQLVAAHGGTVRAESDGPGKGARFVVSLPARGAVPAVASEVPAIKSSSDRPPMPLPRLDGLKVLVVDDEPDTLEIFAQILDDQGAEVTAVTSAMEAFDVLPKLRPDVIVSDIGMPDMDGLALLRKTRSLPAHLGGRTPALALTAYARREDAQRAFAAGFQMHAAKPVEPAQLVTMVANLGGLSLEPADAPGTDRRG